MLPSAMKAGKALPCPAVTDVDNNPLGWEQRPLALSCQKLHGGGGRSMYQALGALARHGG